MPVNYPFENKPTETVSRISVADENGMDFFYNREGECIGSQSTNYIAPQGKTYIILCITIGENGEDIVTEMPGYCPQTKKIAAKNNKIPALV